jgi:hypothetical protein
VASGGSGVAAGEHDGHAGSALPVVALIANDGTQLAGSPLRSGGARGARTAGSNADPGTTPD